MKVDVAVVNGKVVLPEAGVFEAAIGITGERVVYLGDQEPLRASRVIDAKGKYVLPGAIDVHVHISRKAFEEEMYHESRSASLGGVTSILVYLVSRESYNAEHRSLVQMGERNSVIDFGFHYVIGSRKQLDEMSSYTEDGVASFKFFMTSKGEESDRLGLLPVDGGLLVDFLSESKRLGVTPCVHCEDIEMFWALRDRLVRQGRGDLEAWTEARPGFVEADGVLKALNLARALNLKGLYIVHLSSADGLQAAKMISGPAIIETCVHYLTKTCRSNLGTIGKINPPLRYAADVDQLWEGIRDGYISVIASDHAARHLESKGGDIWRAGPGFPGLATLLPVALTEGIISRGIPIERMCSLLSSNPARVFGLYPRKGTLLPRSDADLVIVDPDKAVTISASKLRSSSDFTPFEGDVVRFWPVLTMVRGEVVALDQEVIDVKGWGKYLRRRKGPAFETLRLAQTRKEESSTS